jgi:hypothetical protein
MAKVVRGGNMFFEDDIKIIDSELDISLNLPSPPIFSLDELQVLYNGHVYLATKKKSDSGRIKVYTNVFGLKETDSPKPQEDKYFAENSDFIEKQKKDFIERVVNGISDLGSDSGRMMADPQIGQELAERINKVYSKMIKPDRQSDGGKGLITKLEDGSVFNSEMQGCERILLLDNKVYELFTIPEYISIFKNSFEGGFYNELEKESNLLSPKEISDMIYKNKDKVHKKVLPMVRNKIWHSDKSGELYLDETYWIPQFKSDNNCLVQTYQKLLEKKIKTDAAGSIKW